MLTKYFIRKTFVTNLNMGRQIRSVVNIEREDFYPFLHPTVQNYLSNFKQDSSTYAQVFPKDIKEFLEKQVEQFKDTENIEVAFVGRSNVGKSSLINTILQSQETKISKTPGKTNFLQFIYLPLVGLSLVDCPGYGYAVRSHKERKNWSQMMENYFVHNKFLKRLFILVDADVGIGDLDEMCIKTSSYSQIEFNIVLTKIDKVKNKQDLNERVERCKSVISKYQFFSPFIFLTSCKEHLGIEELKCYLLFLNLMQDYNNPNNKI